MKGSPRLEDYPVELKRISGESDLSDLVTARDAENVAIIGGHFGWEQHTVPSNRSNQGGRDWDSKFTRQKGEYISPNYGTGAGPWDHGPRPGNLVRFINCRNVLLSGVTVQNSPAWTIQFHGCEDVSIHGLNINSHPSGRRVPNDDGIDLRESRDMHISDCNIQTGDDGIAVFGSQNVTVANCTLASRSAGIHVGYAAGDIRNCTFQNFVIDSNCGRKVNVRENGSVEDVLFSNIVLRTGLITGPWWGKGEPVNVSAVPMRTGAVLGRIGRGLVSEHSGRL
ncbi:MAG: glycosyl hydrolase family 28 protein [Bryobacteraceae bacterium]